MFIGDKKTQNIFTAFLDLLGVEYTDRFSDRYLADFKIENLALRLKDKENGLSKLEAPFVAYVASDFALVKKITSQQVQFKWKEEDISAPISEFLNSWTGIVLLANPDENSKEPEFEKHLVIDRIQKLKKVLLFFGVILLCVFAYISKSIFTSLETNMLLFLNIMGACVSYLLLMKQMNVQSKYADKICTLFKEGDCNSILESNAAKLFNTISWSEIGLGYFIANSIFMELLLSKV